MGESVLQGDDEIFCRLPTGRFAVSLAAVTQYHAKYIAATPLAVRRLDPGPGAKVYLSLLAGRTF
jgi:hypothetical protein